MNRRNFLQSLAGLPLLGALISKAKAEETQAFDLPDDGLEVRKVHGVDPFNQCGWTFCQKPCRYEGTEFTSCDKSFQDCMERGQAVNFGGSAFRYRSPGFNGALKRHLRYQRLVWRDGVQEVQRSQNGFDWIDAAGRRVQ